jgi:hypothetical protein
LAEEIKFPHLFLIDWPFGLTVTEFTSRGMADRKALRARLETIRSELELPPTVLYLVWGWYGAGKSHALKYMKHLIDGDGAAITVIHEFPKSCKSFVDVYQAFASKIDPDTVIEIYRQALPRFGNDPHALSKAVCPTFPDFGSFLYHLQAGIQDNATVAWNWFTAGRVNKNALNKLGIFDRIERDETALKVIDAFVRLVVMGPKFKRLVWMIDEFQTVGLPTVRGPVRSSVLDSFNTVINNSPEYLTLFLSFSSTQQDRVYKLLTYALRSRAGLQQPIEIPELSPGEASTFVADRLGMFRSDKLKAPTAMYPFEEVAVEAVLDYIKTSKCELIPRVLIASLDVVLRKANPLIKSGEMSTVTPRFARDALKGVDCRTFSSPDANE